MSRDRVLGYVAVALAAGALALSIRATVRAPYRATAPAACVDQEARADLERLRRAVAQRDALIARLRGPSTVPHDPLADAPLADVPLADPPPAAPAPPARYVRFDIPSPAVTIVQKDDGTYDIRTSDPSLAGTVLTVTGYTETGEATPMIVRVPP